MIWEEIWNKREISHEYNGLEKLLRADGFDSGAGKISIDRWIEYTEYIKQEIDIQPSDSIFEVGCGCGAFLYPYYLKGHLVGELITPVS